MSTSSRRALHALTQTADVVLGAAGVLAGIIIGCVGISYDLALGIIGVAAAIGAGRLIYLAVRRPRPSPPTSGAPSLWPGRRT